MQEAYKKLSDAVEFLLEKGINRYKIFELVNALTRGKPIDEALKEADIELYE